MIGPVIELTCAACGKARRMDRMDVIRETSCYLPLDVVLLMLSRGCEGRGGDCGLRFTNVAGAGAARSIVNRRGSGWLRRRSRNVPDQWRIAWDGWNVGVVTRIPHGPSKGLWTWNTATQRIRGATERSENVALAAIKAAVVFGAHGLPESTDVGKVRRVARGWSRSGVSSTG